MPQVGSPVIGIPEVFRMRDGMVYSDVMRGYLSCSGQGPEVGYLDVCMFLSDIDALQPPALKGQPSVVPWYQSFIRFKH